MLVANCKHIRGWGWGGTMNAQQSMVDSILACQSSQFKLVNRTEGSENKIQWNYSHYNGT